MADVECMPKRLKKKVKNLLPKKSTSKTTIIVATKSIEIRLKSSLKSGNFLLKKIKIALITNQSIIVKNNEELHRINRMKNGLSIDISLKRKLVTKLITIIPIVLNQKSLKPKYCMRFSLLNNFITYSRIKGKPCLA